LLLYSERADQLQVSTPEDCQKSLEKKGNGEMIPEHMKKDPRTPAKLSTRNSNRYVKLISKSKYNPNNSVALNILSFSVDGKEILSPCIRALLIRSC
jgi:hypothetical protein